MSQLPVYVIINGDKSGLRYKVKKYMPTGEWYFTVHLDGAFLYGHRGFDTWESAYKSAIS